MGQIVERTSSKLPNYKERRLLASILPLVDTNGSVKKLTLLLPGLALLQSPRTKYLVAWLVFIRFVRQIYHQWRTSAIPPKTSQPCDVIQGDLQNMHFPNQHQQLNNTTATSSTTINLKWSKSQGEWRHQQLWPTMTLGWIGLTPNITRC
jgi:hypothetical protein